MEKSTDTSKRKMRNIIIIPAAVVVVAAVAIAVIINVWFDKHSSAKAAANAAFDAIYSGQYDLFVESTVYNSDCQEKIGLEELGFLQSSIKPMFDEAVEYLKEIDPAALAQIEKERAAAKKAAAEKKQQEEKEKKEQKRA